MNSNSNFKTPLPTGLLSPDSGGAGEGGLGGKLLKQYWGYDAFRGIQEDIINSITEGRDTLGLMPRERHCQSEWQHRHSCQHDLAICQRSRQSA